MDLKLVGIRISSAVRPRGLICICQPLLAAEIYASRASSFLEFVRHFSVICYYYPLLFLRQIRCNKAAIDALHSPLNTRTHRGSYWYRKWNSGKSRGEKMLPDVCAKQHKASAAGLTKK